ncbi:hypothetical protein LTR66_003664 [Elasticomyces elasticus]|nr:hypothetical protein LTR66_003664 [Elasticomyces elasticus]
MPVELIIAYQALLRPPSGSMHAYNHDLGYNASNRQCYKRTDKAKIEPTQDERDYEQWRYYIPNDPYSFRPLGRELANFFQTALKLANGDPGVRQEVVLEMASEGGLRRVMELTDQDFARIPDDKLKDVFYTQILPFFQCISHPDVLASAILERHVGTIYNYLFGYGGARALAIYGCVARLLSGLSLDDSIAGEDAAFAYPASSSFDICLKALSMIVDINGTAQVTEGFQPIVETISACFSAEALRTSDPVISRARKSLRRIEQRLGLGVAIPETSTNAHRSGPGDDAQQPKFALTTDPPGDLSSEGPRHDNDHQNIRHIRIMPTAQEVQSLRNEYLPTTTPAQWHVQGLRGLLDRHFRLLREDTVGQLRDAVRVELERLRPGAARGSHREEIGARTTTYANVFISHVALDKHKGLEIAIAFAQRKPLINKTLKQREEWWEQSKRLGGNALICLLSSQGCLVFCTVSEPYRPPPPLKHEIVVPKLRLGAKLSLCGDEHTAYALARPVSTDPGTQRQILEWYMGSGRLSLVEFPGVLLPAFHSTLLALQNMTETLDMPFAEIIVPKTQPEAGPVLTQPPRYASRPGFKFDLSCLMTTAHTDKIELSCHEPFDHSILTSGSSLDKAQATAVVNSLIRGLALIQGPPGTGKSYCGGAITKVLVANQEAAMLGPILCVCYTNHALDQHLEHLYDSGIKGIIRLGSGSKSKKLVNFNIRKVAESMAQTIAERSRQWQLYTAIDREEMEIDRLLRKLDDVDQVQSIEVYLTRSHPRHCAELIGYVDDQGFQEFHRDKDPVRRWLHSGHASDEPPRPLEQLQKESIRALSLPERQALYHYWISEGVKAIHEKLSTAMTHFHACRTELDQLHQENHMRCL